MESLKFSLTFSGTVSPNGGDIEADSIAMTKDDLVANLEQAVSYITGNGLVTGETPATLEDHDTFIRVENESDDENLSSVAEEIDSMDWHFSELARLITDLEKQPSASSRESMAKEARLRMNTLVQRAYRAKQVSSGLRVYKAG